VSVGGGGDNVGSECAMKSRSRTKIVPCGRGGQVRDWGKKNDCRLDENGESTDQILENREKLHLSGRLRGYEYTLAKMGGGVTKRGAGKN